MKRILNVSVTITTFSVIFDCNNIFKFIIIFSIYSSLSVLSIKSIILCSVYVVGVIVGVIVKKDGYNVGLKDGFNVISGVGGYVGFLEGFTVGIKVGSRVGIDFGFTLGIVDGSCVGIDDGSYVGIYDG